MIAVAKSPKSAESVTLRSIAREANKRHTGPQEAIAWAVQRLSSDPELLKRLEDEILTTAVSTAVYQERHVLITGVKRAGLEPAPKAQPPKPCQHSRAALMNTMKVIESSWLRSWRMPDGRTLADWTGAELIKQAESERREIDGAMKRIDYFLRLGMQAGEKTIAEFGEKKAHKLWQEIDGGGQNKAETHHEPAAAVTNNKAAKVA